MGEPKYAPIIDGEDQQHLENTKSKRAESRYSLFSKIFLVTTVFFASLSALLAFHLCRIVLASDTFKHGFVTDLAAVKAAVQVKSTVFTGGLKYDEHDNLYREIEPGKPQYVGQPSRTLDTAWDDLLRPLGMVLRGDEAASIAGTTYQEEDGSWLLTLDVFHSLHCVNLVRQALDVDYYGTMGQEPRVFRIHVDHCLDYLRQALQCSSDLTPLTYEFSETRGRRYPVFGAVHTCRDFRAVHDWATRRLGNYSL